MSALASDPVEGFQVASEAVAAPHAKAPTATRTRNKLLWQPPTLARYRFGERGLQMITHCVPTAPGRARLFFAMVTPAAGANALMRFAVTRMPRWLGHFSQHAVLDGDNCFLYMQDRELRRVGGQWRRHYYLPTSMDTAVAAARRWFTGAPLPWPPGAEAAAAAAPPLTRRELLDRFESHTAQCASCSRAFRTVGLLQRAALVAGAAAALAAASLLGAGARLPSAGLAAALGGAAASAAALLALRWLEQRFVFLDYVHAEH